MLSQTDMSWTIENTIFILLLSGFFKSLIEVVILKCIYRFLALQSVSGVIECLKIITREKSRRIAKFAFDYATKKGRNKVTAVHKANIMYGIRKSSFFFINVFYVFM